MHKTLDSHTFPGKYWIIALWKSRMGSDKLKRTDEKMTKKRPVERQKMRPWLQDMLQQGETQGLEWFNEAQRQFKINWKHGSRHGFNTRKDASLFEKYARHTGRWDPNDPNPKRWKANFRCALNSLQNVMEIKKLGESRGVHAFRVYQFLDEEETKPKEGNTKKNNKQKTEREKSRKIAKRESRDSCNQECPSDDAPYEEPTTTFVENADTVVTSGEDSEPQIHQYTYKSHMAGCVVRVVPRKRPAAYTLDDSEDIEEMQLPEIPEFTQPTKRRRRDTDDESMMSYSQPSLTDESSNSSTSSNSSVCSDEEFTNTPYFTSLFSDIMDVNWEVEKEETVTTTQ
ncbi:uncharacterized protein LOC111118091 isoform X2 [Crassostrea virginica]